MRTIGMSLSSVVVLIAFTAASTFARSGRNANSRVSAGGPRLPVQQFAHVMEDLLRENDHKGGWQECSPEYLLGRLREEVAELEAAVGNRHRWPREEVRREAADVGNFAMMIADVFGDLSSVSTGDRE